MAATPAEEAATAAADARMTSSETQMKHAFDSQIAQIRDASTKEMNEVLASHAETVRLLVIQKDEGSRNKSRYGEKLSEKSYKRIEKFAGDESNWQDWKYDFEILTGALSKDVARELG